MEVKIGEVRRGKPLPEEIEPCAECDALKARCERYRVALEQIREMTLGNTMRWPVFLTADETLKEPEGGQS